MAYPGSTRAVALAAMCVASCVLLVLLPQQRQGSAVVRESEESTAGESLNGAFVKLDAGAVQAEQHTELYLASPTAVHVRRGNVLKLTVDGSAVPQKARCGDDDCRTKMTGPVKDLVAVLQLGGDATTSIRAEMAKAPPQLGKGSLIATFDIPVAAPVGGYSLTLDGAATLQDDLIVHVLFNPWHHNDTVYLPSKYLRQEHLNSAATGVCTGRNCKNPIIWSLEPNTPTAVGAVEWLLRDLPAAQRALPWAVSRHLAAKVNSEVMLGKWDGSFADGTSPTKWTGSSEILKQFMASKQQVKYAQCWVFAGVLSTLLRAVGIPTRTVSADRAAIAHNRPFRARIYRYWQLGTGANAKNYYLDQPKSDGMWYYHVWNDAWMARADLQGVPVGWQAVDGTPQKWAVTKGQPMVLGPASLTRIKMLSAQLDTGGFDDPAQCTTFKDAQVCKRDEPKLAGAWHNYDEAFISSEVNSDKLELVRDGAGAKYHFSEYTKDDYAKHVMTQKPATERGTMIDVQCDYKATCAPSAEKMPPAMPMVSAPLAAAAAGEMIATSELILPDAQAHPDQPATCLPSVMHTATPDLEFSMVPLPESVPRGKVVTVKMHVRLSHPLPVGSIRTVHVTVTGFTHDNQGQHQAQFRQTTQTVVLSAQQPEAVVQSHFSPRVYEPALVQHGHDSMSFGVLAQTEETQQRFATLERRPMVALSLPKVVLSAKRQAGGVMVFANWFNPHRSHQVCGCELRIHLIGTAHTAVKPIGCVSPGAHARGEDLFEGSLSHDQNTPLSANAVLACSGGIHISGYVST